jgi:hypothetical protein
MYAIMTLKIFIYIKIFNVGHHQVTNVYNYDINDIYLYKDI